VTLYFVISLAALVAFVYNEHRSKHPLMPLSIFKIRNLSGANVMQLLIASGMFSIFFFTSLYLQQILHYSPIKTGVSFLVVPIIIAITATNVPRVIKKVGFRPILIIAPLFVSAGLFWLSHIPVHGTYWANVAPGLMLLALGMGATFVSLTIAATAGVPGHQAGLASGLVNTSQQIGGALGLAILTGIASSGITNYLANLHARPNAQSIAAATVHGFHQGYLVASTFGIAASLIAIFVIRVRGNTPDAAPVIAHAG